MPNRIRQKRIILYPAVSRKYYECFFPSGITLAQCAADLCSRIDRSLRESYEAHEHTVIVDGFTGEVWDASVTLEEAEIRDGYLFILY